MRLTFAAVLMLAAATPVAAQIPPEPTPFNAEGWVADLQQTREAMASHYANLQWAATEREAPLGQLFQVGEQRLRAARSDAEAREVFDRLEQYLGDGHVDFVWAPAPSGGAGQGGADERPPCDVLGYRADGRDGSAIATRLPGYQPLEGESGFPAGIVEIDGRKLGVIRIAQLSPRAHPAACAAAFAAMSRPADQPCDEDCLETLRALATDNVTDDVSARLRALRDAGAETLLVDLAGNGGGTEWVEVVARVVTPVRLRSERVGFPRHPHWVENFAGDEQRLTDAARGQPRADRARLEGYRAVFTQARQEAATPCDPTPLFAGRPLECEWLTTAPLYSTGPVAELDPSLIGKPWAAEVFTPLRYRFEPGVWTGPLMVMVDGATASASEEFAAVLQDNRAAVIVGAPTRGAGCGHANGEIETVLNHSGARLRLPNCARLREDGTNEVSGIDPDILIGFRSNDGNQRRIHRLMAALPAAIYSAEKQAAARPGPAAP
ncbi:S41 family peptidase [Brevundimonas sp. NPDC092305]|uniref:S41 family peptidase n=1 Tax=Brevundimonas sp. NPDC092305 TaxID=3363957 RepID=UPI0037F28A74